MRAEENPFKNEEEAERAAFALLDKYLAAYGHALSLQEAADGEALRDEVKGLCREKETFWNRHRAAGETHMTRLDFLMYRCQMNQIQLLALLLALAPERDIRYEFQLGRLQQDNRKNRATAGLAIRLAELTEDAGSREQARFRRREEPFWTLLERGSGSGFADGVLLCRTRVLQFLSGNGISDSPLSVYGEVLEGSQEEICIYQKEYQALKAAYEYLLYGENQDGAIVLRSAAQSGRHFLMRRLAGEYEKQVVVVHLDRVLQENAARELPDVLALERLLTAAVFVFDWAENLLENGELRGEGRMLLEKLTAEQGIFFYLTTQRLPAGLFAGKQFAEFSLHSPSPKEKAKLWRFFGEAYLFERNVDFSMLGGQYVLQAGEIRSVLITAKMLQTVREKEAIGADELAEAVRQHDRNSLGAYASRISCVFSWDDLVVTDATKRQLLNICNQVKYRTVVADDWDFYKKTPYGRGICAMFYGTPGTGKTMAVQVLAKELGLELYRIDLSAIVSKYIGETEKNITELFERAKGINALLFFDEADALFAKRCDGGDVNSRNANAETAHLLQKIEEYEGIAILATNLKNNIDPAFSRRIKFMVRFEKPDAATRKLLWEKMFPQKAPVARDIDFQRLAEEVELSGSAIKEVVFNAAHMAAAEGCEIGMEHIREALRGNVEKEGGIYNYNV